MTVALDQWAKRAKEWAAFGSPEALGAAIRRGRPRGVLYVISVHKERKSAAAMALIECVA